MATPIQIADARISLACTSAISKLQAEAEAIHRRAAAKGMLKSGNTIIEVKELALLALKDVAETLTRELVWALSNTFFTSPFTIDGANAVANKYIGTVGSECSVTLHKTVLLCGEERHFSITEPELKVQEQQSRMAVSLALEAKYSELKFQRLRAVLGFMQKFLLTAIRAFLRQA